MNKKILIALGVSLALNFSFLGFEVAKAVFHPGFPPPERVMMFKEAAEVLTPPPAQEVMAAKHALRPLGKVMKEIFKTHRQEMADSKKAIVDAVRDPNFDTGRLGQALAQAAAVRRNMDDAVQAHMLEIISDMTPEERAGFAAAFEKGPRFKKPHAMRRNPAEGRPDRFGGQVPDMPRDADGMPVGRPPEGPRMHRPCPMPPAPVPCRCAENLPPPPPCPCGMRNAFPRDMEATDPALPPPHQGPAPENRPQEMP